MARLCMPDMLHSSCASTFVAIAASDSAKPKVVVQPRRFHARSARRDWFCGCWGAGPGCNACLFSNLKL